ncbi:MAG: hypothetical protein ACI4RE_00245 [Christensenellales bacterium]
MERTMRVLDLDLDFFLQDCCPLAPIGERPTLAGHAPWPVETVRAFLEMQCGLSLRILRPARSFRRMTVRWSFGSGAWRRGGCWLRFM